MVKHSIPDYAAVLERLKANKARVNESHKKSRVKKSEEVEAARHALSPNAANQNQAHASPLFIHHEVQSVKKYMGENFNPDGDAFCASKLEVDEFSNPRNKEGTDQSTNASRNPLILVRNEQGDGRALTQSDLVTDSNNKSGLVKVLSLIVGVGSEQVALDSEWSIQLATEDLPGRLWKRTGQGKRTGTELGRFAVEFVIYKDLVQLVKDGVCGFNIEQEEDTIERIRKLYRWSSDKKYWVKPAYDGHKRRSEYCRERYEKKKAAAAASPNSFDHDETTNPSVQAGEEGSPLSAESSSSSSSNKRDTEDENASANNIHVNKKSKQTGLYDFFKKK